MNEMRVREEVAKWLWCQEAGYSWNEDAVDSYETKLAKETYRNKADQILKIKGLVIEADDQTLPDISETAIAMLFDEPRLLCKSIQQAMVEDGWRKIVEIPLD